MRKFGVRLKIISLLCLSIALICLTFWLASRYPALNLKALMGGQTNLSGIGFDTVITISANHSTFEKIFINTLNWLYTNRKGMTFGLMLAPAVLLLFSCLAKRQTNNRFFASSLGAIAGAPLGVCANCVAPIAISLQQAKARLEITLAMIVSSPTLNVIAITMLFTALPIYLAILKLVFVFLLILLAIPLITALGERHESLLNAKPSPTWIQIQLPQQGGWKTAAHWVVRQYIIKAYAIFIRVVPLMIFAGIVGAIFITLVPAHVVTGLNVQGYGPKIVALLLVSTASTLIPAPMTFDIIMAINLHELGAETRYVAAVLFGLGAYSLYPYFLLIQNGLKLAAHLMLICVVLFSFAMGCVAHFIEPVFASWEQQKLERHINERNNQLHALSFKAQHTKHAAVSPVTPHNKDVERIENIQLETIAFNAKTPSGNSLFFTQQDAKSLGLDKDYTISINGIIDESYFNSIVSEDINADQLPDLLLSDESGLRLFINQRSYFVEQQLPPNKATDKSISFAAIVDINNDEKQDIIFAVEDDAIFHMIQDNGWQAPEAFYQLPGRFVTHMSFADINKDGQLDLLLANWTAGSLSKSSHMARSINTVLLSQKGTFSAHTLGCRAGETLSSLISHINPNYQSNIIMGNDFAPPDCFYNVTSAGTIQETHHDDWGISHNPLNTMSYESADFNNDGLLDVFATDTGNPVEDDMIRLNELNCKANTTHAKNVATCQFEQSLRLASTRKQSMSSCLFVEQGISRETCVQFTYMQDILENGRDCSSIPPSWQQIRRTCEAAQPAAGLNNALRFLDDMRSQMGNVLYMQSPSGELINSEAAWQVKDTGWSWNAQAADINNDGWQDLYIATGYFNQPYDEANRLFINQQGTGFSDVSQQSGANSYAITAGYTYIDYDFDGDLDIISNPINRTVEVFKNHTQANSIAVQIVDESPNRTHIGATIRLIDDNNVQFREVKLSGGFAALSNTVQYFGLGDLNKANRLEVTWPDGTLQVLERDLVANNLYIVRRLR